MLWASETAARSTPQDIDKPVMNKYAQSKGGGQGRHVCECQTETGATGARWRCEIEFKETGNPTPLEYWL
jgi:hypothetical protein